MESPPIASVLLAEDFHTVLQRRHTAVKTFASLAASALL